MTLSRSVGPAAAGGPGAGGAGVGCPPSAGTGTPGVSAPWAWAPTATRSSPPCASRGASAGRVAVTSRLPGARPARSSASSVSVSAGVGGGSTLVAPAHPSAGEVHQSSASDMPVRTGVGGPDAVIRRAISAGEGGSDRSTPTSHRTLSPGERRNESYALSSRRWRPSCCDAVACAAPGTRARARASAAARGHRRAGTCRRVIVRPLGWGPRPARPRRARRAGAAALHGSHGGGWSRPSVRRRRTWPRTATARSSSPLGGRCSSSPPGAG